MNKIILIIIFTAISISQVSINEIMSSNSTILNDLNGDTPDWIELYNNSDSDVNLFGYGLSDDIEEPFKFTFPDVIIQPDSYLLIFASGNEEISKFQILEIHAGFKIRSEGETLILTNLFGEIIDMVDPISLPTDISFGRQPDGGNEWLFFLEPTPNSPNNTEGFSESCKTPTFSHQEGFYTSPFELILSVESGIEQIYYTLDGSLPNENSFVYSNSIYLDHTTVVRVAVNSICTIAPVITKSYFFNQTSNLPVVSLTTDPFNLWDEDYGIYVMGNGASSEYPYWGANFWQDWEKPVHIEFFEPTGHLGFSLNAGFKIFGGYNRGRPQKSVAIYPRLSYGIAQINYQIFPDKQIDSFKSIVLRNAGNDWIGDGQENELVSMFRDGMNTGLMDNTGIDHQAYRPAVVYINGEYWGIHNIREKVNEEFLASNNPGVDPNELDQLEFSGDVLEGNNQDYLDMINFVEKNYLSDLGNYSIVENQIDIENFIDYNLIQIYIGNTDWPSNNIKFWRPHIEGGKWKWILFDTDKGFGQCDYSDCINHNTLLFALEDEGPGWPNPPWSTLLFRKLMEAPQFQNKFINRFSYYYNTRFTPDYVEEHITEIVYNINAEMLNHISRWGGNIRTWNENINLIKDFGFQRADIVKNHIQEYFEINETSNLNLSVFPPDAGYISIANLSIPDNTWSGEYFNDIPIDIGVIPNQGYIFSHWIGVNESDENITITVDKDLSLKAFFVEDESEGSTIFINEILANNQTIISDEVGEYDDWIELYNSGVESVNIGGLFITDDAENLTKWMIPIGTMLDPQSFLLIWCDEDQEQGEFHTNFKLSQQGEDLFLVNADGSIVLSSISFGSQVTDISYGRTRDGAADWQYFESSTPSTSNFIIDNMGDVNEDDSINIFDVVILVNFVLDGEYNSYADMNQDGSANLIDIVQLVNIIFDNSQILDATYAVLKQKGESLYILGDGYIGAVEARLSHGYDFSIELTDSAMISKYKTNGSITTLVVVAPTSEKIFTVSDSYNIEELIVANSLELIDVNMSRKSYLSNAYPNPFNNSTNIDFNILNKSNITIKIYDLLGKEVATLLDSPIDAGYHHLSWDATNIATGIYFIQMYSDDFRDTKKILLIK